MRAGLLNLILILPWVVLGFWIGGPWGALGGGIGAVGLVRGLSFVSHRALLAALPGSQAASLALTRSYGRVLEEGGEPSADAGVPKLVEYMDPVPNAFWGRSSGGDAVIAVSRGLITLLSENELRSVLRELDQRVRRKDAQLRTWSVALAMGWSRLMPQGWSALLLTGRRPAADATRALGPARLLGFLAGYPVLRFLGWCAGPQPALPQGDPAWDSALRKLDQVGRAVPFALPAPLSWLSLAPARPLSSAISVAPPCA